MKHIALETLGDISYRTIIDQAVTLPFDRINGATIDEMRKGIRVLDALENADGVLELEDADWEYLCAKIERMPWSRVDRRFVQFYDDVMRAEER